MPGLVFAQPAAIPYARGSTTASCTVAPDVPSGGSHKGRDYTNRIVIDSSRPFLLTADMAY